MSPRHRNAPGRGRGERATGLLSTAIGVAVVTGFLGLAAGVALGLWSRSTVEAVAHDAARQVAATPAATRSEAASSALTGARRLLGRHGEHVDLEFEALVPDVVLHVRSPGVSLLPRLAGGGSFGGVDHRIVVHGEGAGP